MPPTGGGHTDTWQGVEVPAVTVTVPVVTVTVTVSIGAVAICPWPPQAEANTTNPAAANDAANRLTLRRCFPANDRPEIIFG